MKTIKVPEELWKKLKQLSLDLDKPIYEVIMEAIKDGRK